MLCSRHKYLCVMSFILIFPIFLYGKQYLTITSEPEGAKIEINGVEVGKTPYKVEIPGAYLRGIKAVFGKLLKQQMIVKISKEGYLPKEQPISNGPFNDSAFASNNPYYVLQRDTFNFILEPAATSFEGSITVGAITPNSLFANQKPNSIESVVYKASQAVVLLSDGSGYGSGFFITNTGVIVTNAHVAKISESLIATTNNHQKFLAKLIYIDSRLDLALLKVEGGSFPFLEIANPSKVERGNTVIAIGTPSHGIQNSITRGIVSAIGPHPHEPGLWIQTDAAINPGNSGGPLINETGEVVGINTQKEFMSNDQRPLQGIGFAIYCAELLTMLNHFSPSIIVNKNFQTDENKSENVGRISISSDVNDAEIYIDGKFVGNTPSSFNLKEGSHKIEVKIGASDSWVRNLEVLKGSNINLRAISQK